MRYKGKKSWSDSAKPSSPDSSCGLAWSGLYLNNVDATWGGAGGVNECRWCKRVKDKRSCGCRRSAGPSTALSSPFLYPPSSQQSKCCSLRSPPFEI